MPHRASTLTTLAGLLLGLCPAVLADSGSSSSNNAPLPDDRLGIRTAPILLLSRPDVRAELNMSAEQTAKAETAITDFWVTAATLKGKTGAAAIEARKQVDRRLQVWFETNLSEPQRNRLLQIDLQWEGVSSLLRPVVADTLNLSRDQRASIELVLKTVREEREKKVLTPTRELALDRAAIKVLDTTQQTRWRTIIGEPFVPKLTSAKDQKTARK